MYHSSIAGFKIDVCCLYGTDKHEYDIGAGEAAKAYQEAKLVNDLSKLIRKSRDVLDGLMNIVLNDHTANKLESWSAMEELENRRSSMGIAFSRNRSLLQGKRRDTWMRPTYYSPPRDVAADANLPVNLLGLDKDDSDAHSKQDVEDDQVSDASDTNADQFGWVYQDGAWRNVFVKESGVDTHRPDEE